MTRTGRVLIAAGIAALLAAGSIAAQSPVPAQQGTQAARTVKARRSDKPPGRQKTSRHKIGQGALFTDDALGDRQDRWQSASYVFSLVRARHDWTGRAPAGFGDLLELRMGGTIAAPDDLTRLDPADRPWAGRLFLGVHSYWTRGATEFNLGGDVVLVGPQTRLDHLQQAVHDLIGDDPSSAPVRNYQIGNQVWPTVTAEVGRNLPLGRGARLRPFAQIRAGDETLLRVGADLTVGAYGVGELMARDIVTGQRYRIAGKPTRGLSLILGADTARVFDSVYLPSSRGIALTDSRNRARAGLHWQGRDWSVFYGATWLGREFVGQSGSQVVGSVQVQVRF